ncbi:MAG TPA: PSD1 and planctomycete cytochrome C domain-containing protein [Bryobacteraceae bacterium]|nr:PSD1 and planctomycete cytochrome C domain-containing protein [Bryobacteraceae bacterium]
MPFAVRPVVLAAFIPLSLWSETPGDFFEMRVRPVLAKNCFACHTSTALGALKMVSSESLLKGGNSGPAVIPGKPEESLLFQAVTHTHARLKMPPEGKLTPDDIGVLRQWIKDGAEWPEAKASAPKSDAGYHITAEQRQFWSFQPVHKPKAPAPGNRSWVKTPIDAFILSRLEKEGLQPVAMAAKPVLLRRAYMDLIGLPPTPEEVDAFVNDKSPGAFAKVVDKLLASPHYGERWGRYWLDVARYTDDKLNIVEDEPYANSFRYRDWVVQAFNDDMPYDLFTKAQIAGDLMPADQRERLRPALGFYAFSAQYQEDRPDVTGKAFLGLTVGCAQCHDHKFDPIPTKDYYAFLGVFQSTRLKEYPLASKDVVEKYDKQAEEIKSLKKKLADFRDRQTRQLAEILAEQTEKYVFAASQVLGPRHRAAGEVASEQKLDSETLERWVRYLDKKEHTHKHLDAWCRLQNENTADEAAVAAVAREFQTQLLTVHDEIRSIEEKNLATLGGAEGNPALAKVVLLPYPRDKYVFWSEIMGDSRTGFSSDKSERVLQYKGEAIDRFLQGEWKSYAAGLVAEVQRKEAELPAKYPFLHVIEDVEKPKNLKVHIRGNPENLGEEAPRAFLSVLCEGDPRPFANGSGRLELAEAIANAGNPLTARVMVNRIWAHHFGEGIVRTPSSFGQLGERPTHPELLDYLASRFVENGWSIKAIHREIMLSSTYALSSDAPEVNTKKDPGNRLYWRANVRRLDVEALRDSVLAVSGRLDRTIGGQAHPIDDECNLRRTIYSFVSRRKLDNTLAVFDFPNANDTAEKRISTSTPLQRLFLLNSAFMTQQARKFADRVASEAGEDTTVRIERAYRLAFGRPPSAEEVRWGREFLAGDEGWPQYLQAILASNEFLYMN